MATAHRLIHQPAELKRVFEEYDSDQDARLTLEEFARLVKDCMYYSINSCSIVGCSLSYFYYILKCG